MTSWLDPRLGVLVGRPFGVAGVGWSRPARASGRAASWFVAPLFGAAFVVLASAADAVAWVVAFVVPGEQVVITTPERHRIVITAETKWGEHSRVVQLALDAPREVSILWAELEAVPRVKRRA